MNPELAQAYQTAALRFDTHSRLSEQGGLIYPVLSRRSGGVSIGINLNPDRVCNFGCVYCQVDRTEEAPHPEVDLGLVLYQLEWVLQEVARAGGLWKGQAVRDIAFAGDGEPTTYPHFAELLEEIIMLRHRLGLESLKLVLITNASRFHIETFARCLPNFFAAGGEIWAKLDAGDEATYRELMRTKIPFSRILENLRNVGQRFPLTLQSCFMQVHEVPFTLASLEPYIATVRDLLQAGAQLQAIQAYTLARPPAESFVRAWDDPTMLCLGEHLQQSLGIPIQIYFGKAWT